jgi:hypothetical protein
VLEANKKVCSATFIRFFAHILQREKRSFLEVRLHFIDRKDSSRALGIRWTAMIAKTREGSAELIGNGL